MQLRSVVASAILCVASVTALKARSHRSPHHDVELATDVTEGIESYVNTALGPVLGVVLPNARAFLGIPYATPPVGPLRWQPPEAAPAWGPTVWQAVYDPPGCIQVCDSTNQPPHICPGATSENCLFANVWTPRAAAITAPLPVIVFIHGGAFKDGYAGGLEYGLLYNASAWVNNTLSVVVAINYRLGAMGFLYQGGSTGIQGNYGLMDQELALQWVRQNIAPFGGDPTKITVIGQSAGAMSIAAHLSRPAASGLFDSAIMHSEPFALPFRNVATGQDLSNVFAKFANCSDGSASANWTAVEACIRALNSSQVLATQTAAQKDLLADWQRILDLFVPWTPTAGTPFLPTAPLLAFQTGQILDVPIILGTVANESNLFINFAFSSNVSELEYEIALDAIMGFGAGPKIVAEYPTPAPPPTDFRIQLSAVATDALFVCPVRNATSSVTLASGRTSPIYLYWYAHVESFNEAAWGPVYPFIDCWPIACHGSELVELFHPDNPALGTNYTAAENELTLTMQWYWANFAATGAPGTGYAGSPMFWPAYNVSDRSLMYFQAGGNSVATNWRGEQCDFWDAQVGYNFY